MPYQVLVVDDEPQVQRFLRPSLIAEGYEVVSAASGSEALERFHAHAPTSLFSTSACPTWMGKRS